MAKSILYNFI